MLRRVRLIGLAVLGVIAVAIASLATPPGHALIETVVERVASDETMAVDVEGLAGFAPFWISVERITVSDPSGVFLDISDASARLSPWRLFLGEVALPEVTIGDVALARWPLFTTATDDAASSSAMPAFVVGGLRIARVEIGRPILGQAAVLSVDANARLGADGSLQAAAKVARVEGGMLRMEMSVDRPANGLGAARLHLREDANGLLVASLGQVSGPAYELSLSASEPPTGPEGSVSLTSGARDRLIGRFAMAREEAGHRLTASVEGHLVDLVPVGLADLIAGPISGEADISARTATDVTINDGRMSLGAVHLSAKGRLGGVGDQLTGQLRVGRVDRRPIVIGAPGQAERTVSLGALDLVLGVAPDQTTSRLDVTGHARDIAVGGIRIPGLGVSLAAEAAGRRLLDPGPLPFAARLEADQIIGALASITSDAKHPLIARLEGDMSPADGLGPVVRALAIDAAGGRATFAGAGRATGVEGRATLRWPDVAALEALTGPGLAGALAVTVEGLMFAPGPRADVAVVVEGTDLRTGQAAIDGMLAGPLKAAGAVSLARDGTATWREFALSTKALTVQSAGRVGADILEGTLAATLADLAVVANGARGSVTLDARASGSPRAPRIEGALGVKDGEIGGRALNAAVVSFQAEPGATGPRGAVTLAGSYARRPLTGGITFESRPTGIAAPMVDVAIGQTTVQGALARRGDGQVEGRLTIKAPELGELAALAFLEARGVLEADLSFTPGAALPDQRLDFALSARDLAVAGTSAASLEAKGEVLGLTGPPVINAVANVRRVAAGGLSIDTVEATARGDGATTSFEVKTAGRDLAGQIKGALTRAADGFSLEVTSGTVRVFGLDTRLTAPLVVSQTGPATVLKSARLAIGGGVVTASGSIEPSLAVEATLSSLPASFLNRFAPDLAAEGRVDATVAARGMLADPQVAWSIQWDAMSLGALRAAKLPTFRIDATGEATAKATTLETKIAGTGLAFTVTGKAPLGAGALDLKANGRVPLALLGASLGREVRATGSSEIAVAITGPVTKPALNGVATLVSVAIADAATGLGVNGVGGRIRFDGVTATLEGVNGQLSQGGRFTVSGPIGVDAARGFPADLRLSVTDGVYSDGDMLRARFGAALALSGPLTSGALASGQVDLGRVEVTLPDRLPSSAANLTITHQNADGEPGPSAGQRTAQRRGGAARRTSAANRPIRLDIAVEARQGIFVRGFGLDAELGGGVRVRGTVNDPTIDGAFDMRRGRFEVLARRFDFSRGKLAFSGDMMPELDFVASTKTSDATVSVVVNGPAAAPEFSFQSTPSFPAEEVVSRLLFDRGIGKLSTVQAVRLVDELGKLSGITKVGVFDSLRRTFGLTDLDIKQDEKGNVAVGIGGQVTDRVRVGVEQGQQPGSGKVIVDVDVIQNLLKGRGEVGADGKGKVGITIEREY